jgi:hypothetical protein
MSSHFSFKSLIFYGVAIGSVLILFKVVSTHGEENVKAQSAIGGRYRLTGNQLPECLKSQTTILTIQQSGVYLNGSLAPSNSDTENPVQEKLSLSGKWQDGQLNLSGLAPALTNCAASESGNRDISVNIQAQQVLKDKMQGKISLSFIRGEFEFTTEKVEPESKTKKEH